MNKQKVLITSSIAPNPGGGVPNVEYYLIEGLKKRGYNVQEYFPKIKSMFLTDLIYGIFLKNKKVDIINAHSNISWNTIGAIRTHHGCTKLGEEIADSEKEWVQKKGLYFKVNAFMEKWCAEVNYNLVVSDYIKNALIKYYGINPIMIRTVYNGIDSDKFYPCKTCQWEGRKELGIPKNSFVVASVGIFEFNKGFHYLKEVIDYCKDNKNIYFIIKSSIKDAEVPEKFKWILDTPNVKFLNYGVEMNEFYNIADIFLSNSPYEPMSLAILEAMSCGRPVIAPNSGGHAEVIQTGINGYVVNDYHDTQTMAKIIIWLSKHPKVVTLLGKNARKRILEKFTIDHMVENYIAAYKYFGVLDG